MQVDWNHDNEVQFYSGFTAIILFDIWDKSNVHIYVNFQHQMGINCVWVYGQLQFFVLFNWREWEGPIWKWDFEISAGNHCHSYLNAYSKEEVSQLE